MEQEEVWDRIAGKWAEFRVNVSPTVEKFVRSQNGKILDVGCGSGQNFMNVSGLEWYGIDFSVKMIEIAKEEADRKGVDIGLKVANVTKLPFENNFFDAVLCFAVIHCVDSVAKRKRMIEEIFRVLKIGGEALVATWGSKSPRLKNKKKECYIPWTVGNEARNSVPSKLGTDVPFSSGKVERYTYIFELNELVELMKSVGFDVVRSWEDRNVNVVVRKIR